MVPSLWATTAPLLTDAKVDSTASGGLAWPAGGVSDDRGDRHEQPAAVLAEGHRQYPRPVLDQKALQPPGVLFAADLPDHWQGEVTVIRLKAHRTCAEPNPAVVVMTDLESGESNRAPGSTALLGGRPIAQAGDQIGDPRCVRFLGAGRPPRRNIVLGLIPGPAQSGQIPGHRLYRRIGRTGFEIGSHLHKRPVVRKASGAEMPVDQRPLPRCGRLYLESPTADDVASGNLIGLPFAHQVSSPPRIGDRLVQPRSASGWPAEGRDATWTTCCRSGASPRRPGCR